MDKENNNKQVSLSEAKNMADSVARVELAMTDDIRQAYMMIGRHQTMSALSKLLTVADTIELKNIKESKTYKHITDPKSPTGRTFARWDEFCDSIGISVKTIDERILNLKTFGQDAIESMNHLGLGVRQLRQLRRLPDDQIEQAKILAKEQDAESLKDLIEQQAVEKSELKKALEKTQQEAAEEIEARDRQLEKHIKKSAKLERKLEKRQHQLNGWESQVSEMNIAVTVAGDMAATGLDELDFLLDKILLMDLQPDHRDAAEERMASNFIAVAKNLTRRIDKMMDKALANYGVYEEGAIPLLDRYLNEAETEEQ